MQGEGEERSLRPLRELLGIIQSTIAMRKKARSSHGCPATIERSDISVAAPCSKRQCIRHRNPSEVVLALEHHKSLLREKIHDRRCQNGDMVSDHRSKTTDFEGQTESANLIQSQKFANCSIRLNFKNKCFQIVYHDKQQIPKPSGPPPTSPLNENAMYQSQTKEQLIEKPVKSIASGNLNKRLRNGTKKIMPNIDMRKKARSSHGCPATIQRSDISMAAPHSKRYTRSDISMAAPHSKRQCIRHQNPSEVVLALEAPPINTHDKSLFMQKKHHQRCQNGDMISDHPSKTTDLDKKPCQISDQVGQTESAIQMQSQKFANCIIRLNYKNKGFQIVYHNKPQIHKSAGPPPMSPLKQSIGIQPVGAPLPPRQMTRPNPLSKAPPSRSKSIVPITVQSVHVCAHVLLHGPQERAHSTGHSNENWYLHLPLGSADEPEHLHKQPQLSPQSAKQTSSPLAFI